MNGAVFERCPIPSPSRIYVTAALLGLRHYRGALEDAAIDEARDAAHQSNGPAPIPNPPPACAPRSQQGMGKFSSDGRPDLRHLLGRTEPVKPRHG
jgi:hypothetical protein